MHYSISMHTTNCRNYVISNVASLLLRQIVTVHNHVEQLLTPAILSNNVLELTLLVNLINLQNTRMVLHNKQPTRLFSKDISFIIIALARENFKVLIFLIARI